MPPRASVSNLCKNCSRAFLTTIKFIDHMKNTPCGVHYTCKNCKRIFFSMVHKNNHEKTRTCEKNLEPSYECDMCGKTFKTLALKKYHLQKNLCDNIEDLTCSNCKIEFSSKIEYKLHSLNKECQIEDTINSEPVYFSSIDIPTFWDTLNYSKLKNLYSTGRKIESLMMNVISLNDNPLGGGHYYEYMAENINSGLNFPFLLICLNNETDQNIYVFECYNVKIIVLLLDKRWLYW